MLLKSVHQKFSNVVLNMDGIDVTRTDTNKGKKCIIVDGFSFRINYYLKNGDVSWRCTNYKCKATIKTKDDNQTVLSGNLEQNHEHTQKKNERQLLLFCI
jgi:hypothetical protein